MKKLFSATNVVRVFIGLLFTAVLSGCAGSLPRYYQAGSGAKADKFPSYFQVRLVNNSKVAVTIFENGEANQGDLVTGLPPGGVETIHLRAHYMETPSVDVVLHARVEGVADTRVVTRNFSFNNYRWSIYGGQGFGQPSPQVYVWEFSNLDFGLKP